jgi:hypothetical protein
VSPLLLQVLEVKRVQVGALVIVQAECRIAVTLLLLLLQVLEVKSLQVGALVKVQAECRIAVTKVTKVQPYVRGTVEAVQDSPVQDTQLVQKQVQQLQTTMQVRNLGPFTVKKIHYT